MPKANEYRTPQGGTIELPSLTPEQAEQMMAAFKSGPLRIEPMSKSVFCPHCDQQVTPLPYLEGECPCCGAPIIDSPPKGGDDA